MTDIRQYHGQVYGRLGQIPHTCRDGRETNLVVWGSFCARCRAKFTFTTPAGASKFQPNRRCQRCKRQGQCVRKRGRS
jgi:hypothetical protein